MSCALCTMYVSSLTCDKIIVIFILAVLYRVILEHNLSMKKVSLIEKGVSLNISYAILRICKETALRAKVFSGTSICEKHG